MEEFTSTFEYDDLYKAVKIIESDTFQHYGVFLDGEIGVFDSYMYEAGSWTGDGMSILVEQSSEINYSDFDGVYNFIDVDSDIGTISLSNTGKEGMEFIINVTGENDSFVDDTIDVNTFKNEEGWILFKSDISTVANKWYMMLVPDNDKKILVLGTQDSNVFGGEEPGGIFIGIEQ